MTKTQGKARKLDLKYVLVDIGEDERDAGESDVSKRRRNIFELSYTVQLCQLVSLNALSADQIITVIPVLDRLKNTGDGNSVLLDDGAWEIIKKAIDDFRLQKGFNPAVIREYATMFLAVREAPLVEITEVLNNEVEMPIGS